MEVIKQTVAVPPSREIRIQLPDEAAENELAEVVVRFKSSPQNEEKFAAMREAATDETFLEDLRAAMSDYERADFEDFGNDMK